MSRDGTGPEARNDGPAYLYVYENSVTNQIYVGIGSTPDRPWQAHAEAVMALLRHDNTRVMITPEPFRRRADALRAEAIAIHIAQNAGLEVIELTNVSGTSSSKTFELAAYRREGTVCFKDLTGTVIVVLKNDAIDARPTLHQGRSHHDFAERARQYWPLKTAIRTGYDARRLIAVQKRTGTIVGDWNLNPVHTWTSTSFSLADENDVDPRGVVGKTLVMNDYRMGNLLTWTNDIRPKSAVHDDMGTRERR